jgi:hypothetical protein
MFVLYRRHAIMLTMVLALGWLLGAAVVLVLGWLSGAAVVAETPITFDGPPAALPLELSAPPLQEAPDPHLPALALEIGGFLRGDPSNSPFSRQSLIHTK